jgi:ABC-type lipoprotein export system ATPase subunit
MTSPIIRLNHVSQRQPDGRICPNDTTCTMLPGELVMITGEEGTGKSTLLKFLADVIPPTSGTLLVQGKDIAKLSGAERKNVRQRIEYLPQSFFGLRQGTAYSNVQDLLEREMPTSAAKRLAAEVLEQVQTPRGFNIHLNIMKLSGGEKTRVAIAIAFARHRQIFLVDEIFAGLSKQSVVPLLTLFRALAEKGTTVIIIAHTPGIDDYFDRVLTMEHFSIVSESVNPKPKGRPPVPYALWKEGTVTQLHTLKHEERVFIISQESGKVLDVQEGAQEDGTAIIQYHYHGGLNQQWKLLPVGGGFFKIASCLN